MTMTRKVLIGALVAVVGVGVAVPLAAGGSKPDPTFKALHRAARASDRLPSRASGPLASVAPASARLVGSIDGHDVYLAPGPEGSTCVLDVQGGDVGGTCAAQDTIKNKPTYSAWRDGSSDTATVVVPVPDAYDRVTVDGQDVPVANNVALTHAHVGQGSIKLEGDSTLEGSLDLDAGK